MVWLWLTVVFANLAEAVAEGRGKAQAETLRRTKRETVARRLIGWQPGQADIREEEVPGTQLTLGDHVVVEAGEIIPGDGDVVEGVASVDESAITGESAPVIRESGGDRSAVTGGTKVLSDRIVVKITSKPGETFIDRMIALVEGAQRQKTPNEIALNILLASLTIIFMLAVITLQPMAFYSKAPQTPGDPGRAAGRADPDHDRRAAVGDRHRGHGPAGAAQRAGHVRPRGGGGGRREHAAAGQDRHDHHRQPAGHRVPPGGRGHRGGTGRRGTAVVHGRLHARRAARSSCWPRIEYGLRERHEGELRRRGVRRVHRADPDERHRPGRRPAGPQGRRRPRCAQWVRDNGGTPPDELGRHGRRHLRRSAAPRWWSPRRANGTARALGVIYLKDIVKEGIAERFAEMRKMGIRTVMITGDNPLTAKAIADESGVDDFLAEATPEDKMALIKKEQEGGKLVAMTGDGTNDAPALAQADVGVAMNTGTSAAKEAGNMVDLDSNPTKLIEIVEIGKQLLITRGALTTFSITNDVAKYFAIIPAMFSAVIPGLAKLNILHLHSPKSAITSAIIFNALIIVALIPLALRGVRYRPASASSMLRRNLLIYGVGGLIIPFIGIWAIDLIIQFIPGFGG